MQDPDSRRPHPCASDRVGRLGGRSSLREIVTRVLFSVSVAFLVANPFVSRAVAADRAPHANIAVADVVTIGTGTQTGTSIDVPVYIRDTSGTPLGIDQPPGSRIQSYSIKVNYSPAASVQSVTFTRAGITSPLTPSFESSPASAGTVSLIDTFQESTNLIPFTSNAAIPGNQVAHLLFNFAPATPDGTVVTLTLDPTLTQLSNESGTTSETVALGTLSLINGSIVFAGSADVGIAKTASGSAFFAGVPFTYNITVNNSGPSTASAVNVTDTLPAGATFVSATPSQGSCSGAATVTCALGSIVNGGTATIALRVTPTAAGPLSNTATVSDAPQVDPNSGNDTSMSSITVLPASDIPALSWWMRLMLVFAISFAAWMTLKTR